MNKKQSDFFKSLSLRENIPQFKGVTCTYRFDIEGEGSWYVTVKNGTTSALEKTNKADCTMGFTKKDFLAVTSGEQNLLTAYMQGRVTLDGNVELASKIHAATRANTFLKGKKNNKQP